MEFTIDQNIYKSFGAIKVGYLIVEGITITKTPPREKKIARKTESDLRQEFGSKQLENDFFINEWVLYSEKMGSNNEQMLPAQIGLIRNILAGRDIPKINNIVDAGNIISAKFRCPVGIFDADKIQAPATLRSTLEEEKYIPLLEENNVEIPIGEVVYSDLLGVFSRYSKDADRTKITEHTKRLFCVIDGTANTPVSHIEQACAELSTLLAEVNDGAVAVSSKILIAK